jgi:hypothetical protein
MDYNLTSTVLYCAAALMFSATLSCSDQTGAVIRCEGLAAVGSVSSSNRVVVAFRNISGRQIAAFKARYEAFIDGETLAVIDFVCDRRTVRKLDSGDEIPFVFQDGEQAFVNYVHFGHDRLPDRFYVNSDEQIRAAIEAGTLLCGGGEGDRCSVFEVQFADENAAAD